jgi:hypothetical protein
VITGDGFPTIMAKEGQKKEGYEEQRNIKTKKKRKGRRMDGKADVSCGNLKAK